MIATLLILPACGKRKPGALTGARDVSMKELTAVAKAKVEGQGFLSRMRSVGNWMWGHPYQTAIYTVLAASAGSVLYWGYGKYQKMRELPNEEEEDHEVVYEDNFDEHPFEVIYEEDI
jgi:hypothetical protein